jgi:hypothetical protein
MNICFHKLDFNRACLSRGFLQKTPEKALKLRHLQ